MTTIIKGNYNMNIDYDTVVRHRVDQLTAGQYAANPLALALAQDEVNQAMLKLIKRRGLLPELLTNLGLCSLCQVKRGRGVWR